MISQSLNEIFKDKEEEVDLKRWRQIIYKEGRGGAQFDEQVFASDWCNFVVALYST